MEKGPSTAPLKRNRDTQSEASPSPRRPQLDKYWNFESVVFQVENVLFSVLKHGFMVKGTPFETMFSTLPVDPMNVEGSRRDIPIVLEDTSAKDFRAFLKVLYPNGVRKLDKYEEWLSVLRLAHKWDFAKIREQAIIALDSHIRFKPPHEQIALGNKFLVDKWVHQGLIEIVLNKGLGLDELMGAPLFFDQTSATKIFYIQSKAWQKQAQGDFANVREFFNAFVHSEVRKVFAEEISRAAYVFPPGCADVESVKLMRALSCGFGGGDNKRKRSNGSG